MEENVQAFCYLHKANNEKNKCLLTEKSLIVIYKGKRHLFDLAQVKRIDFNSRRLMLPLLTGGIFAPLSVIAIFKELYDPWRLLFILFISLFLFYYGWIGHQVITVTESVRQRDFAIPLISPNIKAFAGFVNDLLSNRRSSSVIYHIAQQRLWSEAERSGLYQHPSLEKEGFIHCCNKNQLEEVANKYFKGEKDLLLLMIDPLKVKSEIKYEDVYGNGQLYPHIYGPINKDAVTEIKELKR